MDGLDEPPDDRWLLSTVSVNTTSTTSSKCEELNSYHLTTAGRTCLFVTMLLFSVTSVLGNISIIIVVALTKKLHTIASMFLINLSTSDFLLGAIAMPFIAQNVINERFIHGEVACQFLGVFTVLCCINSVVSIVAIAMDRYSAIIHCLYYASPEHRRQAIAILAWTWFQALVCSCCPLVGWGRYDYIPARFACSVDWTEDPSYTLFMAGACFVLPLTVLLVCYGRILRVARQHARRISDVHIQLGASRQNLRRSPSVGESSAVFDRENAAAYDVISVTPELDNISVSSTGAGVVDQTTGTLFRSKSRATRRLFLVVFVFLVCWLPYIVVNICHMVRVQLQKNNVGWNPAVSTAATWLALMASALNPLVYGFGNRKFRSAVRRLYRKLRHKHCRNGRIEEIETISRRMSSVNIPTWRSRSSSTASSLNSDNRTRSTRLPSVGGLSAFSAECASHSRDDVIGRGARSMRSGSLPESTTERVTAMSRFTTTGHFLDVPKPSYSKSDILKERPATARPGPDLRMSLATYPGLVDTFTDKDMSRLCTTSNNGDDNVFDGRDDLPEEHCSPKPKRKRSRSESFVNFKGLCIPPTLILPSPTDEISSSNQSPGSTQTTDVMTAQTAPDIPVTIVTEHGLDDDIS